MIAEGPDIADAGMPDAAFVANCWRSPYAHRPPSADAFAWHGRQPNHQPTPLFELPGTAAGLGYEQIWVKDERRRWGTNSFKILGASWALHRALNSSNAGQETRTLVAATDGNHGRAVARLARSMTLQAQILVPAGTERRRIRAIEAEGASVHIVAGTYDEAVALAATTAANTAGALLVSDTALHTDDLTPEWAIQGYGTLYREIDQQLPSASAAPDLILIQIGAGGLAAAAVRHFRTGSPGVGSAPYLIGVEPATAACAAASVRAGKITTIDDKFDSVMAGLNTGTPSVTAWQDLKHGMDGFLVISDRWCSSADATLTRAGCKPGATGTAGFAGLLALQTLAEASDSMLAAARRPLVIVSEDA